MGHLRHSPILFDLDGTLIDSGPDIAAAVNRCLDHLDLPRLPVPEIVGYVGDGVRKLMSRVLARHGVEDVDGAVRWFKKDYFAHLVVDTKVYEGIEEMLTRVQGAPLAVVTNKPADMARKVLDELGLAHFFGAVVGGDEGPRKPQPDPLRLALKRLGVDGDGGLMVGDHPNDILSGHACGLSACGVTWGLDGGAAIAEMEIEFMAHSPKELADWLTGAD